jgi:catechol 2,3-dioxygenase-like lactoylglutathione lyase family enzyme
VELRLHGVCFMEHVTFMGHIISKLLRDFETGKMSRRQLIQSLGLAATAAAAASSAPVAAEGGLKMTGVDHPSYRVPDYKRTRDFYADLFGLTVTNDTGTQCQLRFGNSSITARNPRLQPGQTPDPNFKSFIDHVAYWVADWDTDTVKAELEKRGLQPRLDLGDAGSPPQYVSFHIKDPDGYDVQISGVAKAGDSQYRKT